MCYCLHYQLQNPVCHNGNFKQKNYPNNYELDLPALPGKHPINELTNEQDRKRLIESLESGNRQSITYVKGEIVTKMFLEAVPQFKSIHIYNSDMKRLKPKQLASVANESTSIKENQKRTQQQVGSAYNQIEKIESFLPILKYWL